MKVLELYKFIFDNNIEYRWQDNGNKRDVLIFPHVCQIEEFSNILGNGLSDYGGIKCTLMSNYFAIWMDDICSYYGIKIEDIFGKDQQS